MKEKVIYTCIVGNYDELRQPSVVNNSYDYICFSNDIKEDYVGVWKIKKIPYSCKDFARLSRYVKLLPHSVLSEYEYSLWIDANLEIIGEDFYRIVETKIQSKELICQVNHCVPPCDCIYEEMKNAYLCRKSDFFETFIQFIHLKLKGFPKHWGLFENNIILRKHNEELVKRISEKWWSEYIKFSKRDQFSLMYVYWINNYYPHFLFGENECTRNVSFIQWRYHLADTTVNLSSNNSTSKISYYLNALRPRLARLFDI